MAGLRWFARHSTTRNHRVGEGDRSILGRHIQGPNEGGANLLAKRRSGRSRESRETVGEASEED